MTEKDACSLADRDCIPCRGGVPPLAGEPLRALVSALPPGWSLVDDRRLEKLYTFRNFRDALAFVNRVGELAEAQKHHPDLHLAWGRVRVEIWTHKIDGLTESDFIFAAKTERLAPPAEGPSIS